MVPLAAAKRHYLSCTAFIRRAVLLCNRVLDHLLASARAPFLIAPVPGEILTSPSVGNDLAGIQRLPETSSPSTNQQAPGAEKVDTENAACSSTAAS